MYSQALSPPYLIPCSSFCMVSFLVCSCHLGLGISLGCSVTVMFKSYSGVSLHLLLKYVHNILLCYLLICFPRNFIFKLFSDFLFSVYWFFPKNLIFAAVDLLISAFVHVQVSDPYFNYVKVTVT